MVGFVACNTPCRHILDSRFEQILDEFWIFFGVNSSSAR